MNLLFIQIKTYSKRITITLTTLLLVVFISCAQKKEANVTNGYSNLEKETEKCLDEWMDAHHVEWKELKSIFENYFISGNISSSNSPVEQQYSDILSYWEKPSKPFPSFKDKAKVITIIKKLKLSNQDIFVKRQLTCLTDNYITHKKEVKEGTAFYAFGSSLETIREIPNISPSIIASALKSSVKKQELKKRLYQKSIVLLFCFDMALFLKDKND